MLSGSRDGSLSLDGPRPLRVHTQTPPFSGMTSSCAPRSMTEQPTESPFDAVPAPLRANLERKGFTSLTTIQQAVVDAEAAGRNLRLSSQTGSGKTVALGIAIFPALEDPNVDVVRALVIAPTRELAQQVEAELQSLYEGCRGARSVVCTGGSDIRAEQRRLKAKPTLVVGTPGRLLDHVRSGALNLNNVVEVVLDEADQMLDMGFKDELDALLAQLPEQRRSHLVSATFPDMVQRLADAFQKDPLQLQGSVPGQANADIEHVAHLVFERDRYAALVNILLANLGRRTLVFVQKRVDAAQVAEMLSEDGFTAMPLSGDLPQAQRNRTLAAFKTGTVEILVATDVAARGIHVDDVAIVVHGDVPRESEIYTHRSGRTGRAGQKGQSLLLVVPSARRRTESMLHQAQVKFQWAPLPSPQKIRRAQTKKARRALHDLLSQVEGGVPMVGADSAPEGANSEERSSLIPPPVGAEAALEFDLEYAARLVEHHDPKQVIAVLLALSETRLPTQPRAIIEPPLHAEKPPAWQTHRQHGGPAHRNRPPLKGGLKGAALKRGPREQHAPAHRTTGPGRGSSPTPERHFRRERPARG
jgi:ATP-dependent RNA helicase DeaD